MRIAPVSALPAIGTEVLRSWGLIRASGIDARGFLNAQLSNDLSALAADCAQWTAFCSAKGRMQAGFLAWLGVDGDVLLACDRALIPALIKRLRMFILRAKVAIDDVSEQFTISGRIGGPEAAGSHKVAHTSGVTTIELSAVDGLARALEVSISTTGEAAATVDGGHWARLMIRAGEFWVTSETVDRFVPQMVNFDMIGGISFKKGCYPGQEVVARAHYRGAVKRRMFRAMVGAPAAPGQALFCTAPNAEECGQIANAVNGEDGMAEVLAVLPIMYPTQGEIRLGAADGPALAFAGLPYAIPDAA